MTQAEGQDKRAVIESKRHIQVQTGLNVILIIATTISTTLSIISFRSSVSANDRVAAITAEANAISREANRIAAMSQKPTITLYADPGPEMINTGSCYSAMAATSANPYSIRGFIVMKVDVTNTSERSAKIQGIQVSAQDSDNPWLETLRARTYQNGQPISSDFEIPGNSRRQLVVVTTTSTFVLPSPEEIKKYEATSASNESGRPNQLTWRFYFDSTEPLTWETTAYFGGSGYIRQDDPSRSCNDLMADLERQFIEDSKVTTPLR